LVQLTLPKNSTVGKGKTWPKPDTAKKTIEFRVYRYDPDGTDNPRIDTYHVDRGAIAPMVVDGIIAVPAGKASAARAR
jgi:succinate dehydrogenase / fumarate reductase, iron-sulfur subunit